MWPPVSLKVEDTQEVDQQKLAIPGWAQEYTQISPGAFRGRTVHAQTDSVEIFEELMNLRVEQAFHAPEHALVFSFDMNENTLYLLNERTCNSWVTPENYRELSVVIKRDDLALMSSEALGIDDLILTPLRSQYCRLFASWLSKMLSDAANGPASLSHQHLGEQLLEDCCFILENGLEVGVRDVRAGEAKRVIQRVIERVNDCPQDNLCALELAKVAGVSVRHLQHLFKQYSGLTPTQWLRTRRLNAARRDLMQASSRDVTVAEVAMRWSFWHLGRFSDSYRALFGEYPRATLSRAGVR
jgi:AraC family transcriptional regulator, ethanolamine operon transcriptional activator